MEYPSRLPQMMQEHLMRRVREVEAEATARKRAMRTRQDALAYQEGLRRSLRAVFGPLPRRTPLKPVITGELERKAYRVQKVRFESRPGFPVTALLYLPKGREFPLPGVVASCGHSQSGKAEAAYQSFCQGLASKGYVVLIYDPISQGERLQYLEPQGGSRLGGCCAEHNQMARQQILLGEFFGTWRVWDGIRACDYLLSRPEVDPAHLGLTGNSGGGTLTTLLLANDHRYTMAAPGCYVTTWRRNAENELPADAEQQPPLALKLGLDIDDFLALHAPRPLILLTQELDFFDQRGAQEAYQRLRHLYKLLGAEENVALFTGPDHHGYARPLREAMVGFFNQACGKTREKAREPAITVEAEEELWVTKTGQVLTEKCGGPEGRDCCAARSVFDLTCERARALAGRRKPLRGEELQAALRKLLGLPRPGAARGASAAPDFRILRQLGRCGDYPRAFATHYVVETEPGIQAVVAKLEDEGLYSRPAPGKEAVLYVPHRSSDEDLRTDPLVHELGRSARAFFAADLRGIGESQPNTCGGYNYLAPYGADYFYASFGLMLGEPLVGRRTYDLLRVMDWLESYGYVRLHLVGRGWGALPACFAAVLDGRVKQVTLKNAPLSFSEWATTQEARWPLSSCLPHALRVLDLPDCYAELKRKKLEIIEPWNAMMQNGRDKSNCR